MALTDAQAKIINRNKKKKEQNSSKSAKASDVVKVTPTRAVTKTLPKATKVTTSKQTAQKKAQQQRERASALGLDSFDLSPLSLLKRDAATGTTTKDKITYAKTSGLAGKRSAAEIADWKKDGKQAARQKRNAAQMLSQSDKKLSKRDRNLIRDAKTSYDEAKEKGDTAGMKLAHKRAETIRKGHGYSGGATGEEYNSPELSKEERVLLNQDGQERLKMARMNLEAAQAAGNENGIAAAERAVKRILETDAFRNEGTKKLSGFVTGHGQTVDRKSMTLEEFKDAEKKFNEGLYSAMAAVPGSILSLVETSNKAIENSIREKNRDYIDRKANELDSLRARLALAKRGEGNPAWGTVEQLEQRIKIAENLEKLRSSRRTVDPNLPGQTLMRKSAESRQKFMEGRTGVDRLLASAGLSMAQMVPALAASAIPGVGPAVGAGIMGAQAAGSKAYELNERGVSPAEAQMRGVVSGGIEALTEKIPISNLLKVVKAGGGASLIKTMAKQAGIEATEESVSYALNYAADVAAKDPEAKFSMNDLLESAAVGAISGGTLGGVGSVVGSKLSYGQAQDTAQPSRLERIGQQALMKASGLKDRLSPPAETTQTTPEQVPTQAVEEHSAQEERTEQAAETPRERFNRRYQDVMARIQAAVDDPAQQTADGYAALSSELQTIMEEGNRLTQQERQEAGQVSRNFGEAESHIDNRTAQDVSARNVKAFQFDHPQLHQYFAEAAQALKTDAEYSFASQRAERGTGTIVQRSEQLARAEGLGLTRQEIVDACDAIINDKGQENYAAAKKVELILDEMLSKGYVPNDGGFDSRVEANQGYIQAKQAIPGAVTGFDQYVQDNSLALELGETTEEELRAEFEAMGAMSKGGAGEFARWQAETSGENFHPINEQAAAVTAEQRGRAQTEIPTYNLEGRLTSKTISTFANANITPNEMVTAVENNLADGAYSHIAYTDSQALQDAESIIGEKGYQGAKEYWLSQVAGGRINKANSTLGIALINRAANSPSLHVDAMDLLSRYADYAKDAGQALQAMNMINKLTPQGQLYTMVKAVEYMEERAAQSGNAVNVEINPELVTAFMEAETQQERNEIKQEMIKDAAAQLPATWRDRFDSWRYLAMLGNARTHVRNVFGNAGFAAVRGVKNVTAAGMESLFGVQDRTTSVLNRFNAEDRARLAIANGEFPQVKELILSGGKYADDYSKLNQERDVWKMDNKLLNAAFKPVSYLARKNSELLDKEDIWFSKPAYAAALARYLKANKITAQEYANMLEGDTRKQEAQAHAIKEAQKATYRDTNDFSEAISRISKWRYDDNKVVRGLGYLAEGVLPFKKTPANILVRAVEYSPVGLAKGLGDAVVSNRAESWASKGEGKNILAKKLIKMEKVLASNAKTPAEAIDEISAGLTGTGLLGLGMALAYLGIATGGASGDDKRDKFNELQGHQNYALEIGNRSLTLDWLAPEALPFFVGIELQKYIQQTKDGEATADDFVSALLRIADPMLEMSMLQGLNDLFNTIGSDYALSSAAWTAATSYLTQFLPTLAGQIERVGEPVRETTFVDPNSNVPKGLQYLLGNIGNKIPGWDYNQVDYVDAWGRTEDQGNILTRVFNNLLNPAYTSQINAGSTEAELMRLYDAGYDSVLPSSFSKSAKIDGEKVSASQWFNMQTERGKTAKAVLDSFIGTEQYNAMTDDERAKFVKKVLEYGSDMGKVKGGADAEETFARWQEAAQNAKAEVGLSEAEIIAASAYQSVLGENLDDDVKASFKQGQFEQWVDSRTDLTDEQKSYIKDNIKFYSMIPANADRYNKVVDSGYSIERTEELLTARSEYADSNNGLYEFVISQEGDYAAQEKLYNAFKDKGATKSWGELAKEQAPVSARIKKAQSALDEAVPAEKQSAFATAISDAGANSQKATKLALLSVDATDAERVAYYNLVSARKGWKKSYYQVDMS